jgi:hypothetical protein
MPDPKRRKGRSEASNGGVRTGIPAIHRRARRKIRFDLRLFFAG